MLTLAGHRSRVLGFKTDDSNTPGQVRSIFHKNYSTIGTLQLKKCKQYHSQEYSVVLIRLRLCLVVLLDIDELLYKKLMKS